MDDGADAKPYVAAGREILPLLRAGFSLTDVVMLHRADDIRTLVSVMEEVRKQEKIRRLIDKLDMAEAVNAALIGSHPDAHHRNQAAYNKWLRRTESVIATLQGQVVKTLWDDRRRSKRLGR